MSLFAGLDMENASDDPFSFPSDFYDMVITDVQVKPGKKDPKKNFLVLEYTLTNAGDYDGETIQEWKHIPDEGDDSKGARQAKAYLKIRLASLGVPENKMDTVTKDDLLNIEVTAFLEKNGSFMNISSQEGHFRLRDQQPFAAPVNPQAGAGSTEDPGF